MILRHTRLYFLYLTATVTPAIILNCGVVSSSSRLAERNWNHCYQSISDQLSQTNPTTLGEGEGEREGGRKREGETKRERER